MHIQKNSWGWGVPKALDQCKGEPPGFWVVGADGGTSSVYRGTESGKIAIVRDRSFANSQKQVILL